MSGQGGKLATGLTRGCTITVFGGSGFLGRHVVQALARRGYRVRVGVRHPNEALYLRPMGDVGQVEPVQVNIRDERSVRLALQGSSAAINLVGLLYEKGRQRFETVHTLGAARIARAAKAAGIISLVHVSAIGADEESPSSYARSKALAEKALLEEMPEAVILRPSIIFGPEDGFFNLFAAIARLSPVLPLIGGGETRFQPVYVKNVADAVVAALEMPQARGRTYELGGPEIYTFRQLMQLVLHAINRNRLLVPLPFFAAKINAFFLQLAPKPLLTVDQVRLLAIDNVVSEEANAQGRNLAGLGVTPVSAEAILPTYLYRFRRTGQFEQMGAR
jgi:uncharacterized protein YbjT (DUF2867 family)